jgi:protein-S-isoprenylcysteine O-methyltransferase Ste14
MLFLRAVVAYLALPGMIGFLVPALLLPSVLWRAMHWEGLIPFAMGLVIQLWCVRDFYAAGKGTLAPWDPPRHLVTTGLYRFSRNPMYIGLILILVGWAVVFRARSLVIYAIAVAIAVHVRVLLSEEPWLARTFSEEWHDYKSRVPRWLS